MPYTAGSQKVKEIWASRTGIVTAVTHWAGSMCEGKLRLAKTWSVSNVFELIIVKALQWSPTMLPVKAHFSEQVLCFLRLLAALSWRGPRCPGASALVPCKHAVSNRVMWGNVWKAMLGSYWSQWHCPRDESILLRLFCVSLSKEQPSGSVQM